jgi:hypothetical protein
MQKMIMFLLVLCLAFATQLVVVFFLFFDVVDGGPFLIFLLEMIEWKMNQKLKRFLIFLLDANSKESKKC